MASAAAGKQAGCFKCGQIGHWGARCTAPPSQRVTAAGNTTPSAAGPTSPPAGFSGTPGQPRSDGHPLQQRPAGATGCYKCGRTGHWSRDCPATPENRSSQAAPGAATPPATIQPGSGENDGSAGAETEETATGVKRKTRPKRPKVELLDLLKPTGLPAVVATMPDAFRAAFKGPGHEARDLRTLLSLYEGWGRSVAPAVPYDRFLDSVEKIGQTGALKTELQNMRRNMMSVLEPAAPQDPENAGEEAEAAQSDKENREDINAGPAGHMDFDDDDFGELLAQDAWAAPVSSAAGAPPAAPTTVPDADDDDLDDLDMADLVEPPNVAVQGAVGEYNPEDDDDLCDIMGLGSEEQCCAPQSTTAANSGVVSSAAHLPSDVAAPTIGAPEAAEDDDDLSDIMGLDSEEQYHAALPATAPKGSSGNNVGAPASSGQQPLAAAAEATEAWDDDFEDDDDLSELMGLGSQEESDSPATATDSAAVGSDVQSPSNPQRHAADACEAGDDNDHDTREIMSPGSAEQGCAPPAANGGDGGGAPPPPSRRLQQPTDLAPDGPATARLPDSSPFESRILPTGHEVAPQLDTQEHG